MPENAERTSAAASSARSGDGDQARLVHRRHTPWGSRNGMRAHLEPGRGLSALSAEHVLSRHPSVRSPAMKYFSLALLFAYLGMAAYAVG